MRWIFLTLLLLPAIAAAHSGWYYYGDSFEVDGVIYAIESNDPDKLLLGAGGRLFVLALADCQSDGPTEYCYTQTSYPDDESHIKYEAGDKLYGYEISVTTYEPEIEVSRDVSEDDPDLGETVEIEVTIDNKGDYTVYDLLYEEALPSHVTLRSGPRKGNSVYFYHNVLPKDQKTKFTYSIVPNDYGEFDLKPSFKYKYENKEYNVTVGSKEINVDSPVTISRYITNKLSLEQEGHYQLNITNDDPNEDIDLHVEFSLPPGLRKSKLLELTEIGGKYVGDATLEPDEDASFSIFFTSSTGNEVIVPLSIKMDAAESIFTYNYNETVKMEWEGLDPDILFTPSRELYFPGTKVTINGQLENKNSDLIFNTVQGVLKSDLFKAVTFNRDTFAPEKKLQEATTFFIIPDTNESKTYTVEFSGSYKSGAGKKFDFSASKELKVVPIKNIVDVTRTVEPANPKPNNNITITVSLKNIYGEYVTVDAHEKYPNELLKTSGLTYAETSLEKDANEQLYIYKLEIPESFSKKRFNVTTVVLTKGEPVPEEFTTEVILDVEQDEEEELEVARVEEVTSEEKQEEKKKLGFFASIVDFFKGLFN